MELWSNLFQLVCFSFSVIFCVAFSVFGKAEVAKQFGTNVDTEDAGMVTARKEFDEKKKALADAFARKARALAEVEDILGEPEHEHLNQLHPDYFRAFLFTASSAQAHTHTRARARFVASATSTVFDGFDPPLV